MLCVVFRWEIGGKALTNQTQRSLLNSVMLQTALRGYYNVNTYRMVFIQITEIYVSSASARSERSRVGEKRHPSGDCAQRPQRGTGERRAHLHETTDGECECRNILLLNHFVYMFVRNEQHNACTLLLVLYPMEYIFYE